MDRRTSIKTFLAISAGITLLPACLQEKSKSSLLLKKIKINNDEEELMATLSETILPKTDTPGAKDLSSHLFVLMMVDECHSKAEQEKFLKGLGQFQKICKEKYDQSFNRMSPEKRYSLLKAFEDKKGIPEEAMSFYATTKRMTVQSYTTSQHYVTKVQVYKLVPGKFIGCKPVSPQEVIVQ